MSEHELDKRVSILEVEYKNSRDSLDRLEKNLEDNREITLSIKERLDKQNGLIPHMAESMKSIASIQNEMMDKLNKNDLQDAKDGTKMKIIWSIFAAIGAALLGYALKSILG